YTTKAVRRCTITPPPHSPLRLKPGLATLLGEDQLAQRRDALLQPLFERHQAVLMPHAEHVVIADEPQIADKVLPEAEVMPVADRAEDPRAVKLVSVGLGVEHAVDLRVERVDLRVFGVDVEDRLAQLADGGNRIDALPEQ